MWKPTRKKGSLQVDAVVEYIDDGDVAAVPIPWVVKDRVPTKAVFAAIDGVQDGAVRIISILFQEELYYLPKPFTWHLGTAAVITRAQPGCTGWPQDALTRGAVLYPYYSVQRSAVWRIYTAFTSSTTYGNLEEFVAYENLIWAFHVLVFLFKLSQRRPA